jgi:hypothetical protein
MRILKNLGLAAFTAALAFTPAYADQWDKKTIITINQPVQMPTTTLQPGTYTLKLLESQSNRHIVTVWDQDGMHLVTTVLAIPNYRLQPTGDSRFSFWETPADQPKALRAWFYPGDNFGQEFAYPKDMAARLSASTNTQVPELSDADSKYGQQMVKENGTTETAAAVEPAPAPAVTPEPEPAPAPAPVAAAAEPTPEPTPAPAPEPEPAPAPVAAAQEPAPTPEPMPATASNWTEIMLMGLLATFVAIGTFWKTSRA